MTNPNDPVKMLPTMVYFSTAYLDGVMEGEPAEIRKHWATVREHLAATVVAAQDATQPKLTVRYGPMPESNGKSNYTAILHSGDIMDGITLDRSEYPDRVRYAADRARYLIGDLKKRPFILDYDADKHSDYVEPQPADMQGATFQQRVQPWMMECFGAEISADKMERNHRFFEEATELVQSCGMTASEAHQLVNYVFGRPVGEPVQESGGVSVTHAALCLAHGIDMHAAAETELARIWTKVDKIRAKQAAKPKHSPLPEHVPQPAQSAQGTMELSEVQSVIACLEDDAMTLRTKNLGCEIATNMLDAAHLLEGLQSPASDAQSLLDKFIEHAKANYNPVTAAFIVNDVAALKDSTS